MGSFNNFLENRVLDYLFGSTSYTPAVTLYIGLSTTTIEDSGVGLSEPSGGSYARVAVPNDKSNWTNAASGLVSNSNNVVFAQATGTWGMIVDFFIADQLTGGNMLAYGTLEEPKTVGLGDTCQFVIGAIDITLD